MGEPVPPTDERERVYLDAARAWLRVAGPVNTLVMDTFHDPRVRAAVDVGVRAGREEAAREITAAANLPGSIASDAYRAAMDILNGSFAEDCNADHAIRAEREDLVDGGPF